MSDFYSQVPKDLLANLRYRLALRQKAAVSIPLQRALIVAARTDFLFWLNAFCWLYEPRPKIIDGRKMPHQIPFLTWPHQDVAIREIREHLGEEDIGVEKARGEGASWIGVYLALHDFLFEPLAAIGVSSRTEAAMDNSEDSDSLMWKMDWGLSKLPRWMLPSCDPPYYRNKSSHVFSNPENLASIAGYAATGDMGSGGRKKWWLMDELSKFPRGPDKEAMASTQHVTNSRLIVATPKGSEGAFFEAMHEPSSLIRVVLDWKDNPTRNRGMYKFEKGLPLAIDKDKNPLPKEYDPPSQETLNLFSRLRRKGFKLEGRVRSPWYDHECDRTNATPQKIAQELDRDYGGSVARVFGHDFIQAAEAGVRPPNVRGTLIYHPETLEPEFQEDPEGSLLLWTNLDSCKKPPLHQCTIGCDISFGRGGAYTSNSVAEVIDQTTMEQLAEFAVNTMPPDEFADYCLALTKFFHGAYLSWEIDGPGSGFTAQIKKRGYGNVYYRTLLWKKGQQRTKEMGWTTNERTKPILFGEIRRQVQGEELKVHSKALSLEFGQYVFEGEGKIVHALMAGAQDSSAKGKAHGDRVIALGVALQAIKDRPLPATALRDALYDNPPVGTTEYRQKQYEDSLDKESDTWDDRENSMLAHGSLTLTELR